MHTYPSVRSRAHTHKWMHAHNVKITRDLMYRDVEQGEKHGCYRISPLSACGTQIQLRVPISGRFSQ